MPVDRCVCQKRSFASLVDEAKTNGESFQSISDRTSCGQKCGLCGPYLKLAIATGGTSFPPMSEAAIEREMQQAKSKTPASTPVR